MKLIVINESVFKFKNIENTLIYHSTETGTIFSDELMRCVNPLIIFTR